MLFVQYKFQHIEYNNTTLCTHFTNLSLMHVWHLLMTEQNYAVSNLYSINFIGVSSVVWNPYFILLHLVYRLHHNSIVLIIQNIESNQHFYILIFNAKFFWECVKNCSLYIFDELSYWIGLKISILVLVKVINYQIW